ncbi:dolichyl-P-Man:Man(5)GlcNAc(2)-PP-dolichol alpha-1,3-mannosyltransferase [Coniosporium tulheliwenetii]|uniref:Dolichyl-P-Man:Man(5)GlcNAc(2)-PP-dolichol alpha-1,3-mannosyltransferase n=1 Tax=Coniosporium tulheliwenetii TaxID=3383036 RepID=A0ACC2ZA24_9PEZI|nr:dolichyl-P-Man:Man(5)GlcNAc(2)-PP-dolichol alpha-1,3-mannosyltransferase [Cladosporium sp. JES 115]
MKLVDQCLDIVSNPRHTRWICPLLLAADAALCGLIIWKIPYTEIDWKAYMEQVKQFINGERDYIKIKGGTGPLVYPGVHVYIYRILYSLTDHGTNIRLAQLVFGGVYLVNLAVVMACYRLARVPPYVFPLLVLSKRLHSIYLLRCFNDCFAVLALFTSIYAYQKRMWTAGSVVYSLGLGVKMSLLLVLPAIGVILLQGIGKDRAITQAMIIGQLQVLIGYPFLGTNARSYFSRAFEFTRQFLYKWTVNWRFVSEETFLSKEFALSLLLAHACFLALFLTTRWSRPSKRSLSDFVRTVLKEPCDQDLIARRITPQFILTTILSANAIGMLCARSLHYQFYSWIAWATPFLLWRAKFHPFLQYALWAAQEWAWNVYPSTPVSSMTVVAMLAVQVAGVWRGTRRDLVDSRDAQPQHQHVE